MFLFLFIWLFLFFRSRLIKKKNNKNKKKIKNNKDIKKGIKNIKQNKIIPFKWILNYIKIYNSKTKTGYAVQLRFRIPQHERDTKLIEVLSNYFGSAVIEKHTKFPAVTLVIVKFSHIVEKVIPFFEMYPLVGIKQNDFLDWCKVAKLMSNKSHLTIEGLNLIRTIKGGMNKGRPKE